MLPIFLHKVKSDPDAKREEAAGRSDEDQTRLFWAKGKRAAWGHTGGLVGTLSTG